jgi:hypothetical protein
MRQWGNEAMGQWAMRQWGNAKPTYGLRRRGELAVGPRAAHRAMI